MASISTNVGTEVLFENERVRVSEMRLDPGESSGLHRHEHDYLFVYVTPDNQLETRFHDGTRRNREYHDGFVQYTVVGTDPAPHMTHELHNVGSGSHRQILVEFLDPSGAGETLAPETNERWEPDAAEEGRS